MLSHTGGQWGNIHPSITCTWMLDSMLNAPETVEEKQLGKESEAENFKGASHGESRHIGAHAAEP